MAHFKLQFNFHFNYSKWCHAVRIRVCYLKYYLRILFEGELGNLVKVYFGIQVRIQFESLIGSWWFLLDLKMTWRSLICNRREKNRTRNKKQQIDARYVLSSCSNTRNISFSARLPPMVTRAIGHRSSSALIQFFELFMILVVFWILFYLKHSIIV